MAVTITHAKVSTVVDSDDTSLVRPSDWNADHTVAGLGTAAESDTGDFATAAQGAKADSALQPAAIGVSVQGYSAILAATTASFLTTDETKLDGIETAADVTDAGNVGSSIHGATGKTTPVDADTMPLIDSAASNVLKKVTWANIKATLKTYLDTLYVGGSTGSTDNSILRADGTGGKTAQASAATIGDTGQILGASFRTANFSIVDDGVATFNVNNFGGNNTALNLIIWNNPQVVNEVGYFRMRPSAASPVCSNVGIVDVTNLVFTTGVALTGTTGTDGKITISAHTDGLMYIENRMGGTRFPLLVMF